MHLLAEISAQELTPGFREATTALGWKLKVFSYDPSNPATINGAMQQAVSQRVNFIAVSGVNSAGFSTTVQPAANAGASFHAAISSGKFQGMI